MVSSGSCGHRRRGLGPYWGRGGRGKPRRTPLRLAERSWSRARWVAIGSRRRGRRSGRTRFRRWTPSAAPRCVCRRRGVVSGQCSAHVEAQGSHHGRCAHCDLGGDAGNPVERSIPSISGQATVRGGSPWTVVPHGSTVRGHPDGNVKERTLYIRRREELGTWPVALQPVRSVVIRQARATDEIRLGRSGECRPPGRCGRSRWPGQAHLLRKSSSCEV
jgi:hypothetical protein